jgi:ClpP class serine protease
MMLWLLESNTLRRMMHAQEHCHDPSVALQWETSQHAAPASASESQFPPGMNVVGSTAEIRVDGVLTKRPDFWAKFFGGGNTTYSSIRNALAHAATASDVREVVLAIDSPGGNSDGLIELLDSISAFRQSSGKKLRVRAENALSAAYGIAAAAGNIEAVGRGASFGSIGTAVSYFVPPNVVTLTNSESPDKRPDLTTDEGKAVVVKYLDQINHEFATAIANGRGVSLKDVTEGFGRGAMMTAVEAKRMGLIDKIATTAPRAVRNSKGQSSMDQETESRAALDAATQRGVSEERDRVLYHITLGESCGDMSIALAAIRSGAGQNVGEVNARYMAAGMNRADRQKRQTESNTAETQLAGVAAASPVNATDLGDQVVTLLTTQQGEKSFVRG